MLFNSISFAIFLPIVFFLYWYLAKNNLKLQNYILLAASYFFYSCWDYRFLFLLIFSTALDYFSGLKISTTQDKKGKQIWLAISIIINLGFLAIFKYYDFFAVSFGQALENLGIKVNVHTLNIILPVGISFYTFHGISYVIDIYHDKIKPEYNFIKYALFVSFFPLLVAGPIERATHLLPQIQKNRVFEFSVAVDGLRQILWGLFKKIVIADSAAVFVDNIFSNSSSYPSGALILGVIFFAFQIYCDFSGYSDIALGTAKLFGIQLLRNFSYPYFARDIAEFWRRWHISLTSWFRDYVYIPLGGNRGTMIKRIRNTGIVFLLSGLWHGANWTFIFWGGLHALFFIPLLVTNKNRVNLDTIAMGRTFPTVNEFLKMVFTFSLVGFAWIFFRADNLSDAFSYAGRIFSTSIFTFPVFQDMYKMFITLGMIFILLIIEWNRRTLHHPLEKLELHFSQPVRWLLYYSLLTVIFLFGSEEKEFIYFQF